MHLDEMVDTMVQHAQARENVGPSCYALSGDPSLYGCDCPADSKNSNGRELKQREFPASSSLFAAAAALKTQSLTLRGVSENRLNRHPARGKDA